MGMKDRQGLGPLQMIGSEREFGQHQDRDIRRKLGAFQGLDERHGSVPLASACPPPVYGEVWA